MKSNNSKMHHERKLLVDIGTSKTVASLFSDGEVTSSGIAPSRGMKNGKIVDIEKQSESIKEATEKLSASTLPDSLVLGMSGDIFHIKKETMSMEIDKDTEITEKDVKKLLSMVGEKAKRGSGWEFVHTIPLTYQVGEISGVVNPKYMEGNSLSVEAMVILILSTSLDNLIRCVNRAGFKVERVIFTPYAESIYLPHKEEKELGVAILDIGEGITEICIFQEGKLENIKILPHGGKDLTFMLASKFHLPLRESERIKKEEGVCLRYLSESYAINAKGKKDGMEIPQWEIAEILEEGMEKFAHELENILKPYLTSLYSGFILTGGFSNLRGIKEFFEDFFSLPCRIFSPPSYILPSLPEYSSIWSLKKFMEEKSEESPSLSFNFLKPFYKVLNWVREKI